MEITQKELRERFVYNNETGKLIYRKNIGRMRKNTEAGQLKKRGYRHVSIGGKKFLVHRIIWLYVNGAIKTHMEIDHINHIKDDNRICNLREVTRLENCRNKSLSKKNTSGYIGVSKERKSKIWNVSFCIDNQQKFFGSFRKKEDAILHSKNVMRKIGFHENHGC